MARFLLSLLLLLSGFSLLPAQAESQGHVKASLLADETAITPGKPVNVGVYLEIQPEWHTYWMNSGDSGMPTRIEWELPEGWSAGEIEWPTPKVFREAGNLITYGYSDAVLLMSRLVPPEDLPKGKVTFRARVSWLVCRELCIPGEAEVELTLENGPEATPANTEIFARFRSKLPENNPPPFTLTWSTQGKTIRLSANPGEAGLKGKLELLPITEVERHPTDLPNGEIEIPPPIASDPEPLRALLILEGEEPNTPRQAWYINGPELTGGGTATSGLSTAGAADISLGKALLLGLVGGFILNLMPCVLPVIALKIFGFLGQAGESRQKVFRIGLAFVAGIYVWFMGIGLLFVGARALGSELTWAFQFQNPIFVYAMALLIFVFSLNLLGVFEIWLPGSGKIADLSGKEGYGGAFLHGVFATLLATPCVAPFLGTALTFAFTQSAPITLVMFFAIATGMGLPYVILTARPGWMRFLPKPGAWMERLKEFMGLLLLGTVIWLIGVYGSQTDKDGMTRMCAVFLGVATACWVYGKWMRPGASARVRLLSLAAMAGAIGLAMFITRPPVGGWEPWSPERVATLRAEGKPIFVDFTADWCVNCKYNERMVIDNSVVREALKGYTMLKADWTKGDPVITAELKRWGRSGVPLYLVYPPGGGDAELLPELLTRDAMLEALDRAKEATQE